MNDNALFLNPKALSPESNSKVSEEQQKVLDEAFLKMQVATKIKEMMERPILKSMMAKKLFDKGLLTKEEYNDILSK